MTPAALPVMVLAHNEESRIGACLNSIFAAQPGARCDVYVLANGCTDRTEETVRDFSRTRPEVHLVSLPVADKCHAWNVFIHEVVPNQCPGREVYFFISGDSRVVPGSFGVMTRALREHPHAHAASATPSSGRNRESYRKGLLTSHGLLGNLYSLRGGFVERLRKLSVRMPLNLEGDDGLVGALVKYDLCPERDRIDNWRIVPCADASFEFDSLSPLSTADWLSYWRRLVRYGRSRYEFQLLGRRLSAHGIAGLPADITELYAQADTLRLRWNGVYTITDLVALRQIRRLGRRAPAARDGG